MMLLFRQFQHACRNAWLFVLFATVGVLPISAGTFELDWNLREARVSADIEDAPIRQVLEQIQLKTGWNVIVEPGLDLTVSTAFKDYSQGRALSRLLSTANFALVPEKGQAAKLMVFESNRENATEQLLRERIPKDERYRLIEDELIITVDSREEAEKIARELGAEIVGGIDELGVYRLKFKDKEAADAARERLKERDDVAVDSNFELRRTYESIPLTGNQIPIPAIRQGGPESETLVIGLVDTALRVPEGEMKSFFLEPLSLVGPVPPNYSTVPEHAESMANDILFQMTELVGPGNEANAKILSVNVFGAEGNTTTFELGYGIVEAYNRGATLINASLGSKAPSPWLDAVINQLASQGAVIMAPSGNVPDGLPTYPAANPNVVAITATDQSGNLAPYANYGSFVDVALPGDSIVTLTGEPYFVRGTSSATAKATGAVAGYMLSTGASLQQGVQFIKDARGVK